MRPIARRLKARLPDSFELEDLIQIGLLRLWEAAGELDPSRTATLAAYLRMRIRGGMIDSLRDKDRWAMATHEELPVVPVRDPALTVEQRMIAQDEFTAARNAIRAKAKRVKDAIADPDPKFRPLSKRQRKILELRYEQSMTLEAAGRKLGISKGGSRELEQRALANLRRKLAA